MYIYMARIKENSNRNYLSAANPDANKGHGYGRLDAKMKPMPISATGFPYDLYELPDEEFGELGPENQKQFANKVGVHTATDPSAVSRGGDPFSYFDDSTVGLAGESLIRDYVRTLLEMNGAEGSGMKSRSSETDGAVNQFGLRIPGGTQFGWSSAFNFKQDQKALEPVFSLKDLMTKHETEWDRTHGELEPEPEEEWKKDLGKERYEEEFPLFY